MAFPFRTIDNFLNSITMYRLVLYGLGALAVLAIVLAALGLLDYSPWQMIVSLGTLLLVCYGANYLIAHIIKAAPSFESADITALILFFLILPPTSWSQWYVLVAAAIVSMASKYVLAWRKKHIFNPAAITGVLLGLFGLGFVGWWVGSTVLLPFVIVLGLLVVRKIRRFALFATFVVASLLAMAITTVTTGGDVVYILWQMIISWPLVFFGTIMLTEPATTPPTQRLQIIYGIIVGVLFSSQFHIGPLFATPELALVIGNMFSYIVSSKQRLRLSLVSSHTLTNDIYEFVFSASEKLKFKAGQYLEWTIPGFFADSRGNRRYFTIASAPTESDIRLGVRTFANGSEFKKRLQALQPGAIMWAGQLAGDFVLPRDPQEKLVFIAGGIGITPFRSMIKQLVDSKEKRDVVLLYTCVAPEHFVYQEIFSAAERELGIKVIYVITDETKVPADWNGLKGFITSDVIHAHIPDYQERIFYLSGPNVMVQSYVDLLHKTGVNRQAIRTDYFPGF